MMQGIMLLSLKLYALCQVVYKLYVYVVGY